MPCSCPCPVFAKLLLNFAYLEQGYRARCTEDANGHRGRNLLGVSWPLTGVLAGPDRHPHNHPAGSSSARASQMSPMVNFLPTPTSASMSDPLYGFGQSASSISLQGGDDSHYFMPSQGLNVSVPPTPQPSIRQEEYIAYYFKKVRELQFVFCGDTLANILYPVSIKIIHGPRHYGRGASRRAFVIARSILPFSVPEATSNSHSAKGRAFPANRPTRRRRYRFRICAPNRRFARHCFARWEHCRGALLDVSGFAVESRQIR